MTRFPGIADDVTFDSPEEERFAELWVTLFPAVDLERNARFCDRRWTLDFLHRPSKVAIELDGYQAHSSYVGFERDRRKDLAAMLLGYCVVRITAKMSREEAVLNGICHIIETRSISPPPPKKSEAGDLPVPILRSDH